AYTLVIPALNRRPSTVLTSSPLAWSRTTEVKSACRCAWWRANHGLFPPFSRGRVYPSPVKDPRDRSGELKGVLVTECAAQGRLQHVQHRRVVCQVCAGGKWLHDGMDVRVAVVRVRQTGFDLQWL